MLDSEMISRLHKLRSHCDSLAGAEGSCIKIEVIDYSNGSGQAHLFTYSFRTGGVWHSLCGSSPDQLIKAVESRCAFDPIAMGA